VEASVDPKPEFKLWNDRPYRRPEFLRDLDWMLNGEYIEDEIRAKTPQYWTWVANIKEKFGMDVNKIFPGETPTTSDESLELADMMAGPEMWAYEGVVGPGGNFIVGRYWEMHGDEEHYDPHAATYFRRPDLYWRQNCGPFLFWLTDLGHLMKD
jgi:hypothetical protein